MRSIRLLIDPPATGTWNMAVDDVLLESAANRGVATLRFYQWEVATLSLGYFQRAADRDLHAGSRGCPLVRRASGGGAIVHDRELTYSLALPMHNFRGHAAIGLYRDCHESLIETLEKLGIAAAIYQPACTGRGPKDREEPFLCFARRTCGDIVCGDFKIVGSAQRRRHRAVLQHGSILLSESPCAAELPGVVQLTGRSLKPAELAQAWMVDLLKRLAAKAEPGELGTQEVAAAGVAQARFASAPHTFRR